MNFDFLLLVGIGVFLVIIIRGIFFSKKAYQITVRSTLNLQQAVRAIIHEKSADFFIIEFDQYYIQYSKFPDSKDVYCSAISNEYLSPEFHLSEDQYDQMKKLDYILPGEQDEENNSSKNFFKFYLVANEENIDQLVSEMEAIIQDIYKCETDTFKVRVNS